MIAMRSWRRILVRTGLLLLATTTPVYAAASFRWRMHHSVHEAALWDWAGLCLALASVPLALVGSGWRRYVFVLVGLADAYLWFSMLALLVQIS